MGGLGSVAPRARTRSATSRGRGLNGVDRPHRWSAAWRRSTPGGPAVGGILRDGLGPDSRACPGGEGTLPSWLCREGGARGGRARGAQSSRPRRVADWVAAKARLPEGAADLTSRPGGEPRRGRAGRGPGGRDRQCTSCIELAFDLTQMVSAVAFCPAAPGGEGRDPRHRPHERRHPLRRRVHFTVGASDDELAAVGPRCRRRRRATTGRRSPTVPAVQSDFYKIDPLLFAPRR